MSHCTDLSWDMSSRLAVKVLFWDGVGRNLINEPGYLYAALDRFMVELFTNQMPTSRVEGLS